MLDLGALLLQHGANQATVDSVASEVDRLVSAVAGVAADELPRVLDAHAATVREVLAQHFDGKRADSVQRQVAQLAAATTKASQEALLEALGSDSGPLGILKAELKSEFGAKLTVINAQQSGLVEQVATVAEGIRSAKALADERARGTAKGRDYEDIVHEVIEGAFAPYQDVVYDMSSLAGATGQKVGDFVAVLSPESTRGHDCRVVIEAKCQKLSLPKALRQLDEAMVNREAAASILVFSSVDNAPLKGGTMRVYPGNRLIVVVDEADGTPLALEVACHLARTLALAKVANEACEQLDVDRVNDLAHRLVAVIEDAKAITRGLAAARKGVDQADTAYEVLRVHALETVHQLMKELAA